MNDLGPGSVSICKVLAHASRGDVDAGRISSLDRVGNSWADKCAKKGAAMHPVDGQVQLKVQRSEACLLYTSPSPRDS